MRRRAFSWACGLWAAAIASVAMAQVVALTEEQYVSVQTAFLQENFQKVVQLAQPLLAGSALEVPSALDRSSAIARMTRVWLWYALSLERLQRTNEALQEIDRLKTVLAGVSEETTIQVSQDSMWPEVLFWEGEISRKGFQLVRARLAYQHLLMSFPNSSWRTRAQLGLGLVLFDQQSYDGARQQVRAVSGAGSSAPWAREALIVEALCDLKLKQLAEANTLFDQLLQQSLEPELRTQVLFYRGEALTGLGRYADASESYRQALARDPRSVWAGLSQFGLGWSEFQQGHCQDSLQAFDAFLAKGQPAMFSRNAQDVRAELWFAQGRCLMQTGQEEQAQQKFDAIRQHFPEHPLAVDATLAAAELLERQQQFSKATALLQPLLDEASLTTDQRQQSRLRWGSLLLASGDAARAAVQFDLAKDAGDPEVRQVAFNGLADAEMWLGHADRAAQGYLQTLQISQTNAAGLYAAYQLGRLAVQAGRVPEAIERFQLLARQADSPLALEAQVALAMAYLSNGQAQDARATLEGLRQSAANTIHAARAGYYLALLSVQEGHLTDGRQLCEEVMQRAPGSEEALDARLLLLDLAGDRVSSKHTIEELRHIISSLSGAQVRQRGKLEKKLAELLRQTHGYAQAIHWYELAWEELPAQRGEIEYRIASCYEELGDMALAIHRYQAATQAPWQIRGQLAAAKLMEREEQWDQAKAVYQRITAQAVPEAKIAQERLGTLASVHRLDEE